MSNESSTKASPKDVFMHILSIGTLYFSAGAFLSLVFTLINIGFPDPANPVYDPGSSLRWSISLLVVLFPVYLWSVKRLHEMMRENQAAKDYRIRRWLINFTLFAAGAFILGDVVALINNFLSGELTIRFILKVLAVFFVAGSIFWYYRYEMKEGVDKISNYTKRISWVVSAVVLAAVVGGFFIAGSPFKQRMIKLDNQRVVHLSNIQNQILDYWQRTGNIPESLSQLEDDFSQFQVPRDPETNEPYQYNKTGDLSFELCATFQTDAEQSPERPRIEPFPGSMSNKWQHDKGEECFERTIDPERYDESRRPIR